MSSQLSDSISLTEPAISGVNSRRQPLLFSYSLKQISKLVAFFLRQSRAHQRSMFLRNPPEPLKGSLTLLRQMQRVEPPVVCVCLPLYQTAIFQLIENCDQSTWMDL